MDVVDSDSSSSQPTSPASGARTTRSSATFNRFHELDPEKIASLAQKLHESLKALMSSKNKTNVSIPVSEFENILSRSQQVAQLTLAASRGSRDDALSLQISDMSDRISDQLNNLESKLGKSPRSTVDAEPIPVDPPTHTPPPTLLDGTRHSSLYLPDGNLVVAAPVSEAGGGTMLFRVHQSMLSLQSPVFASMFTLPHPDANQDIYDGAPFVRMPDDAKDIESLLKVLYHPSELPYKRLDPLTPINVRRTLAMATKYEMEPLRDRIVTQLQADWPNSLAEWDRLETEVQGFMKEHGSREDSMVDGLYIDERLPEPAAAIRISMDWNIPKIRPSAVYHLSRLSIDHDWLEYRKDRTWLNLSRTARWDLLQAADLKMVLKLREVVAEHDFDSFYASAKTCRTPDDCSDFWDTISLRWQRATDPLDLMRKFTETRPAHGLCKYCWNEVREDVRQCRATLWNEICDIVALESDT
ncbi:hypothetical protein B0H19DRAFT_1003061 [Mycena capillaripes]|nr:hypothetical protein B0H19DRAFT_1003061 [Mycena capillaripes]